MLCERCECVWRHALQQKSSAASPDGSAPTPAKEKAMQHSKGSVLSGVRIQHATLAGTDGGKSCGVAAGETGGVRTAL